METNPHTLETLFIQLGLPHQPAEIDAFVATHRLPKGTALADAPFWTTAQAALLRQSLTDDADWCAVVDGLALSLS